MSSSLGLRKLNAKLKAQGQAVQFTYSIHERDESAFYRGGGFSLTIHWALQQLYDILPEELSARIFECVGNPEAIKNGHMGSFTFLNLRTGNPAFQTSLPQGWKGARMSRVRFLELLMTDLDIQYSNRLSEITFPTNDKVRAHFENGHQVTGDLLVGADGANSVLPVRMLNCRSDYALKDLEACLKIDPHLFHAGDPVQNGYFMFAFLDMPSLGSTGGKAGVQLTISWPYESGYLDEKEPSDAPTELPDQLAWLKRMAEHWANPVYDLIQSMPDNSIVRVIAVREWMPNDTNRRPTDGRITTVSDAAHLMTSSPSSSNGIDLRKVVSIYEEEMFQRSRPATLKAREACLDANHYSKVASGSPFLSRRTVLEEEERELLKRST
ncbi:hypothetical protein PENNAL_c0001G03148 [Penicillium nalgiovense]|uniref:FAD-binding domain-containing protein n=1 Tax=Penicillium nalgiovense TaxID=60175 RepID=A0A1V6ZA18_PENNA|nr:hypothetical protein PENNAL_c0001G03148 [Penicillium nalgiovense]